MTATRHDVSLPGVRWRRTNNRGHLSAHGVRLTRPTCWHPVNRISQVDKGCDPDFDFDPVRGCGERLSVRGTSSGL